MAELLGTACNEYDGLALTYLVSILKEVGIYLYSSDHLDSGIADVVVFKGKPTKKDLMACLKELYYYEPDDEIDEDHKKEMEEQVKGMKPWPTDFNRGF